MISMSKMAHECAILVPIYPPHFNRAKNLLNSFITFQFDQQADLYFIFTNEEEANLFFEYEKKIVLPPSLVYQKKGIINVKKLFALKELYAKYKYLLVLDAESQFVKHADLLSIFSEFFSNKILYGNTALENTDEICEASKKFFSGKDYLSKYDSLYLWFNQLCVYKSSTVENFFKVTQLDNRLDELTFLSFDYYIYMYYLILYENFSVIDLGVRSDYGMLEGIRFRESENSQLNIFNPHLCNKCIYSKIKNKKNIFIFIHLDRSRTIIQPKFKSFFKQHFLFLSKLKQKFLFIWRGRQS